MNVPQMNPVPLLAERESVEFVDVPHTSVRRWDDLLSGLLSLLGMALVWGASVVLWSGSSVGDRHQAAFVQQLFLLPLAEIEGVILLAAPVSVFAALLIRGDVVRGVHALISASVAVFVAIALNMGFAALPDLATVVLRASSNEGTALDPANVYVVHGALVALSTFLLLAGEPSVHRSLRWSWGLTGVVAVLWVVRGYISFPAAVMSVLLGHSVAMLSRWVLGVDPGRPRPGEVIRALRSVGVYPTRVVARVLPDECAALGVGSMVVALPGAQAYSVESASGRCEFFVFSPSQRLVGALSEVWHSIRLRGISRWIAPTRKAAVERALLAALSAENAGVPVAHVQGLVEVGQRYGVLVRCFDGGAVSGVVSGVAVHHQAWQTLALLHGRGVAHRNISAGTVHHFVNSRMGMSHWEYAQVGASIVDFRVDQAQLLAALAVECGDVDEAVLCARMHVGERGLRAIAPFLQRAVLPVETVRGAQGCGRDFLRQLRDCALALSAEVAVDGDEPEYVDIERFSVKTAVMAVLGVAGVVALSGMLDLQDIVVTLSRAILLWVVAGFVVSMLTWVGGAMTLLAVTPAKVSFRGALLAQVAASFVTLVAPAGMGPAGVNVRFLTRQKVAGSVAVAVVALQQVIQLLMMVTVLVVMVALTGVSVDVEFPRGVVQALMVGLLVATLLGAVVLAVPGLRRRLLVVATPMWSRLVPQVQWVLTQPSRVGVLFLGNVVMNVGFIGAFWASMRAVGVDLAFSSASVVYLTANSVGSVVPSPGGIGAVEAALAGGLQVAGVPLSAALAVAVVYRVVTFYGRVPLGWVALNVMKKRGDV